LRSRGLLVRVRGDDGEPSWELAHDSLVPRVLAWIDAHDLARRRAIELVRYHLRRSRADAPSLLGLRELRELKRHGDALVELDAEWKRRSANEPWSPSRLVARSRQVLRRTIALLGAVVCMLGIAAGVLIQRGQVEAERRRLDLGRFVLELQPFDWDPVAQRPIWVDPATVRLTWALHAWETQDEYGDQHPEDDLVRGTPRVDGHALVEHVEARGGHAYLLITRGPCAPTVVPLIDLPGYAKRERQEPVLHVPVPTCAATRSDTLAIPAGLFIYGGIGDPPSVMLQQDLTAGARVEQRIVLPEYRIDRTEVTNGAFAMFASMARATGVAPASYPTSLELKDAGDTRKPVTGLDWHTAHAYCRYLGKELPSAHQWVKAMRGGLVLPDGTPNPMPTRNLPWGKDGDPQQRAQLYGSDGDLTTTAEVGTHPGDVSPYGVLDLTGNAQEWTDTRSGPGFRQVRGGCVATDCRDGLIENMAIENPRRESSGGSYELGLRCAINPLVVGPALP
jgi:formylglycine-generating enzyme required for sulfatase activity